MTKSRRPAPATETGSHVTATNESKSTAAEITEFDFDRHIVDSVDQSIWRAVYNGEFRLAVRCDVCGRWLTDGRSKRAHRGPRCASKAADHG